MAKGGVRDLLRDRHVRALAVAELVSSLGGGVAGLAITYFTYHSTGSLLRTVLVTAAYTLPAAIFGLAAGRVADRHSRRAVLIWLYIAKAFAYLAMAALSFAGVLDANWLLVTSFVAGTLGAFVFPSWEEYEKDLIPPEQLSAVNALFSSSSSVAALVGAVAGGFIVDTIGITAAFVLDTLSFIPLVVVLVRIHPREVVNRGRGRSRGTARRTFAAVRTTTPVRKSMRNIAVLSLLAAPVVQLLPAVAGTINPASPATLGFVTAVYALGGAAVAWVITRLRNVFDRAAIVELSILICSIALLVFGVGGHAFGGASLYGLIVLSLLPVGLALSLAQSVISAILQIHAPPEVEGDVFALYAIIYSTLAPLGAILLGRLATATNVFDEFALVGLLLAAFSAYVMVDVRRRRASGDLPPAASHLVMKEHGRPWGLGHGLWMHQHLRFPLTLGDRRRTTSSDAG